MNPYKPNVNSIYKPMKLGVYHEHLCWLRGLCFAKSDAMRTVWSHFRTCFLSGRETGLYNIFFGFFWKLDVAGSINGLNFLPPLQASHIFPYLPCSESLSPLVLSWPGRVPHHKLPHNKDTRLEEFQRSLVQPPIPKCWITIVNNRYIYIYGEYYINNGKCYPHNNGEHVE